MRVRKARGCATLLDLMVGRNASTTKPAKLVVVLQKKKGVDVVLPAE